MISGVDFFGTPATSGTTANAVIQTTEVTHDNKPLPVHPQRAGVVMNLSSVLIGGGVSDLGQLQTAANQGIGKWVDRAVFGYVSEVFGAATGSPTGSGGVAVAGSHVDAVYAGIMDNGIATQTAGIVASTDISGKIRGLTVGTAVPYVQGERIHGIPFYGYPLDNVPKVGAIIGAHFEYIQVQATPLTIVPNWTTVTNNTIQVNLYADVGAGTVIPSANLYVDNLK